jgi:hypothetical protein
MKLRSFFMSKAELRTIFVPPQRHFSQIGHHPFPSPRKPILRGGHFILQPNSTPSFEPFKSLSHP